jgi:hypothetical protein
MTLRITSFLVLGMLLAAVGCNRPAKPSADAAPPKPAATLTADQLLDEYNKNQLGADQKYKDKIIKISGKVTGIKKTPLLGYYVGLGTAREGETFDVMCYLDSSHQPTLDRVGQLKEGDTVTFLGKCEGRAGGVLALYVRHCIVPD